MYLTEYVFDYFPNDPTRICQVYQPVLASLMKMIVTSHKKWVNDYASPCWRNLFQMSDVMVKLTLYRQKGRKEVVVVHEALMTQFTSLLDLFKFDKMVALGFDKSDVEKTQWVKSRGESCLAAWRDVKHHPSQHVETARGGRTMRPTTTSLPPPPFPEGRESAAFDSDRRTTLIPPPPLSEDEDQVNVDEISFDIDSGALPPPPDSRRSTFASATNVQSRIPRLRSTIQSHARNSSRGSFIVPFARASFIPPPMYPDDPSRFIRNADMNSLSSIQSDDPPPPPPAPAQSGDKTSASASVDVSFLVRTQSRGKAVSRDLSEMLAANENTADGLNAPVGANAPNATAAGDLFTTTPKGLTPADGTIDLKSKFAHLLLAKEQSKDFSSPRSPRTPRKAAGEPPSSFDASSGLSNVISQWTNKNDFRFGSPSVDNDKNSAMYGELVTNLDIDRVVDNYAPVPSASPPSCSELEIDRAALSLENSISDFSPTFTPDTQAPPHLEKTLH